MVILSPSQIYFAVFLAHLSFRQAEGNSSRVSSHDINNTLMYDGGFGSGCRWNCAIIGSDFPEKWKTFYKQYRLIKVVVKYEKKVTEQCAKLASRNSSGNATEYFNVWLPPNNKLSSFHHAMQGLFNLIFSSEPDKHVRVKGVCQLRPHKTGSAEAISIPDGGSHRSHLADHGLELQSSDRNAEMNDLQPYIDASKANMNSYDGPFSKGNRWSDKFLNVIVIVFANAFMYYSPAFICLFSPTVVTENGLRQIVLEGASPVSFRSLLGNYLYSEGNTIWQKAVKLLFLRLVLLPLPFLALAILAGIFMYGDQISRISLLYHPIMIFCYVCYAVLAIRDSLFKTTHKPCFTCWILKPVNVTCNDILPRRILSHLRLQPLILVKCWRCFVRFLFSLCKLSEIILPTVWFLRIPVLIAYFIMIPVVVFTSLATMLLAIVVGVLLSSPTSILCGTTSWIPLGSGSRAYRFLILFAWISLRLPSIAGANFVLLFDGFAFIAAIRAFFVLLISEDSLPYVSLLVLVCYYLWSSYSSCTDKYHDLSLILFKCYQEYRDDQISNEAVHVVTTDPVQAESTKSTASPNNKGNVIKIPKELFDMACEELMPLRESVCELFLKVILILSFVFLVFFWIMKSNAGATPVTKALLTFFTGLSPKIVAIYNDRSRKQKLQAMVIEERAPTIVQSYITRSASADQEQDISATNTEEVIIADENEETIQLMSMETS